MKKTIVLISLFFCYNLVFAQEFNEQAYGFNFNIDYVFTGQVDNEVDSVYAINVQFELKDTTHISKLYLQIGTSYGAHDILVEEFLFDSPTQDQELMYNRSGSVVTIGIGRLDSLVLLYYEAKVEDIYGHISEARYFN